MFFGEVMNSQSECICVFRNYLITFTSLYIASCSYMYTFWLPLVENILLLTYFLLQARF